MNWRAPWLKKRVDLAGMAAWDWSVVYICYLVTFWSKVGRWDIWSGSAGVAAFCWISASYVIGRYSREKGERIRWTDEIVMGVITTIIVLVVFVGHGWVTGSIEATTKINSFLLPMTGTALVASLLGNAIMNMARKEEVQWCIACTSMEREILIRELESEGRRIRASFVDTDSEGGEDEMRLRKSACIAVGKVEWEKSGTIQRELLEAKERGARVVDLIGWCEINLQRIPPEFIRASWLIGAEGFSLRQGGRMWRVKRFGDIIGSIIILAISAPLAIVAAIAVKVEDSGPIFYKQKRTGLNGSIINIWKIRSMRVDAEQDGIQWSRRNDQRVTRIGKVIRAARVDELPQLISVLKGDLSLIGPRPERPEVEVGLEREIRFYRVRHWVRPGMSGWAQVCYPYGASLKDSRAKLSYDLFYIRNAGILMDFLILAKTIKLVLRADGSRPDTNKKENCVVD